MPTVPSLWRSLTFTVIRFLRICPANPPTVVQGKEDEARTNPASHAANSN